MTRIDGYGNRYELLNEKAALKGFIRTCKNNQRKDGKRVPTDVELSSWNTWEVVAGSNVTQEELF